MMRLYDISRCCKDVQLETNCTGKSVNLFSARDMAVKRAVSGWIEGTTAAAFARNAALSSRGSLDAKIGDRSFSLLLSRLISFNLLQLLQSDGIFSIEQCAH